MNPVRLGEFWESEWIPPTAHARTSNIPYENSLFEPKNILRVNSISFFDNEHASLDRPTQSSIIWNSEKTT